jgi:branched-chain amino acid transport system ATP-binding protein
MSALQVEILQAGYGNKVVLREVAIDIAEESIVALIGPNGAGKSTLLKAIMGMADKRGENITTFGQSIAHLRPEQIIRKGVSFLPQGNRIFTELTVLENLEVGGYLIRDQKELNWRVEEILALFPEIDCRRKEDAGRLSGGEKQQLALARAMMLRPKILLLDEPSLGLSPRLVSLAFGTLRRINMECRTTILIVEQKVREVLSIADKVYALRMGQIAFEGTPDEIRHGDNLKRIFFV